MTTQFNIAEAKGKLSELVARAEAGEEIVLARAGKPIVVLTLCAQTQKKKRVAGAWAHLGPLEDPDLFAAPDPVFIETAQSRDEDTFYQS